jgi:hypothetical protein
MYKKFWEELIAYFLWHDTDRIENDVRNNSSIVAYVGGTHIYTDWRALLSTPLIYIPNFIKIGWAIQKLIGGIHRHTDSMEIT